MTIATTTALFNLALNAIGARSNIASPTENSREAQVCSLWYEVVRDSVLAAAPWPELTRLASLTLVDTTDPTVDWTNVEARPGYSYVYSLPNDCLQPQYLSNFSRFFLQQYSDKSQVLCSNTPDAILAYTTSDVEPGMFGPGLGMAMTYALASHICMPLSGKVTRAKQMVDQANNFIMAAREDAGNSQNDTYESVPDWLAVRGFANTHVNAAKFIYPYGNLLTVSAGV